MAGPFDQAQAQTDLAKRQALAALARGGSAAMAEHKAAQDQMTALRAEAIKGALFRATAIHAPEAGAELAAGGSMAGLPEAAAVPGVGAIYDRYSADQGRAGAMRKQAMGDMAAANANYFGQVNAARPIVEGQARAARERALAEMAAKAAKEAQGDDLSDSELRNRLMGAARVAKESALPTLASLPTAERDTGNVLHSRGSASRGSAINAHLSPVETTARRFGVEAGLDPSRVYGVVGDPRAPKAPKEPTKPYKLAEVAPTVGVSRPKKFAERRYGTRKEYRDANPDDTAGQSRPYDDAILTAEAARKEKWTAAELNQALRDHYKEKYGRDFPAVRKTMQAMYGHLLGGA